MTAGGRQPGRDETGQRVEPVDLEGGRRRIGCRDPAKQRPAPVPRRREPFRDPLGVPAQPLWRLVDERVGETGPGQSASRSTTAATPSSATLATSVAPSGAPTEPVLERVDDGRAVRRTRRGGPTRRSSGRRCPAGTGRSCPAYSSASTTNAAPLPQRAVAGGPPVTFDGSSAPTNADGSAPATVEHVDEPARGGALAVGPGDADERAADRGVGDDLLPRFEGDAERRARPRAPDCPDRRRSGPASRRGGPAAGCVVTCSARVPDRDRDPGGVERPRV